MTSPLPWIILLMVVLALAFVPRWGLLAAYRRWRARAERERIEDALKLLLDYQWQKQPVSVKVLAASLRLSDPRGLQLAARMQGQGLVEVQGNDLRLSPAGESAALQITRTHRLLERYLADEARMPLQHIHSVAHRMEHAYSPAQVDELDAAMGFPRRDPHGDPIPGPGGELPAQKAVPLTAWEAHQPGKIVHLEDEPPLAYAQILAEGLKLQQVVRVIEKTPERYLLTDGENEYRLAPAVAANIMVEPLPEAAALLQGVVQLGELAHDQQAEIVALDEACQGFTRRRFLDLGLTPGTLIYPELLNAFGDPRAYRVRGTLIALRRDQAAQILVKPV